MSDIINEIYDITDHLKAVLKEELKKRNIQVKDNYLESDEFESEWNDKVEEIITSLIDDEE